MKRLPLSELHDLCLRDALENLLMNTVEQNSENSGKHLEKLLEQSIDLTESAESSGFLVHPFLYEACSLKRLDLVKEYIQRGGEVIQPKEASGLREPSILRVLLGTQAFNILDYLIEQDLEGLQVRHSNSEVFLKTIDYQDLEFFKKLCLIFHPDAMFNASGLTIMQSMLRYGSVELLKYAIEASGYFFKLPEPEHQIYIQLKDDQKYEILEYSLTLSQIINDLGFDKYVQLAKKLSVRELIEFSLQIPPTLRTELFTHNDLEFQIRSYSFAAQKASSKFQL